jgi:hypothetical protein
LGGTFSFFIFVERGGFAKCNQLFKNEKVRAWLRGKVRTLGREVIWQIASCWFRSGKTPEGGKHRLKTTL